MIKAACIQLCSGVDIEANLAAAGTLIKQAATDGATFIATPEMTHLLQRSPKRLFASISPEDEDKGVTYFSLLAAELQIDLLIGSLAIQTGETRAANRSYLFGRDGDIKAKYDKIHLFDVTVSRKETWKESSVYGAGNKGVMTIAAGANIGLSICYDLRFPALYRRYARAGAQIIMVPAAFTRPTGRAHWEVLLRARAIETGAYIIAPAQGGVHEDGRETWGHSLIIDPWGDVLAQLEHDEPGYILADIDLNKVEDVRRRVPAWQHEPGYTF